MNSEYLYTLYGLIMSVPFPCPELVVAPGNSKADVVVSFASVPRELLEPIASDFSWKYGFAWQISGEGFLLCCGRRAGRFLVKNGAQVDLELNPQADMERVVHYFLHNVMAAILNQRGLLVLHGNAVSVPRGVVALIGQSGSGKSTTQAALVNLGGMPLTDDITALRQGTGNVVEVLPGIPRIALFPHAAERLGFDTRNLTRNPLRHDKMFLKMFPGEPIGFSNEPLPPLQAIYYLSHERCGKLRIIYLSGNSRFKMLLEGIYGPLTPEDQQRIFPLMTATAVQADVYYVERPADKWTAQEIAEIINAG